MGTKNSDKSDEISLEEFGKLVREAVFDGGLGAQYNFYREQVRNSREYPEGTGPDLPKSFRLERASDGRLIFGIRVFPGDVPTEAKSFGYAEVGKIPFPVPATLLRKHGKGLAYAHVEEIDYGTSPYEPMSPFPGNPVIDISCAVPAKKYNAGLKAFKRACKYASERAGLW